MTQKPIDAHCHLFSARYVVEEAAFEWFQKRVIALVAEGAVRSSGQLFGNDYILRLDKGRALCNPARKSRRPAPIVYTRSIT